MATVETQIYNSMQAYNYLIFYMVECYKHHNDSIVQTIIHHHSKVFTTGQASVNPEHYVTKCVGGR